MSHIHILVLERVPLNLPISQSRLSPILPEQHNRADEYSKVESVIVEGFHSCVGLDGVEADWEMWFQNLDVRTVSRIWQCSIVSLVDDTKHNSAVTESKAKLFFCNLRTLCHILCFQRVIGKKRQKKWVKKKPTNKCQFDRFRNGEQHFIHDHEQGEGWTSGLAWIFLNHTWSFGIRIFTLEMKWWNSLTAPDQINRDSKIHQSTTACDRSGNLNHVSSYPSINLEIKFTEPI